MKLRGARDSKLNQGRQNFIIVIAGIILLFVSLLTQPGCASHPKRLSLDDVDKIEFVFLDDRTITIDPELASKIINIYNNSSKSAPKGDMNTPESQMLIYLKNNRKIVINNLDGIEFETHVVMANGPGAKVFKSNELEQIFNSLKDRSLHDR